MTRDDQCKLAALEGRIMAHTFRVYPADEKLLEWAEDTVRLVIMRAYDAGVLAASTPQREEV